ncbi:MAG: Abi family protein [Rothia sp. (in: high G+C Gram-positive bacteria)]|nr:Abi family protein [Rothia sp. (in: high G+C Gram-positive bacteria)]
MLTPRDMPNIVPAQKPWLNYEQQVQKLIERGLGLGEVTEQDLQEFLARENYYRFSGYYCQFYETKEPPHYFLPGTTAQTLLTVYSLDAQLRLRVFEGVQSIEPLLRAKVAYYFSQGKNGATKYRLRSSYEPRSPDNKPPASETMESWKKKHAGYTRARKVLLSNIEKLLEREEIFLQHFKDKNQDPPLWAVVEVMSLGDLSKMISLWKNDSQLSSLARDLGFRKVAELKRAVGNINYFRNISAHHSRLWGRTLSRPVAKPPWDKVNLPPFRFYPRESPISVLLLLSSWVDYLQGNSEYSSTVWNLVEQNDYFRWGLLFPKL